MASSEALLSIRAKRLSVDMDYISNYSVGSALQNPFDETKNPEGIINFGTAVSGLMDELWLTRFSQQSFFTPDSSHYRYYQCWGVDTFREALSKFMNIFFKPKKPIIFENLYVLNGALLSLDILGFLLADEGESFVFLTPGYNGYYQAGFQRWGIHMVPVPLQHNEESGEFELTVSSVEKVISDEESKGRRVRAFVFNNPENPLGKVFTVEIVKEIMNLCQRRKIHLIADEIYCMSVFDENTHFHSVLEIHNPTLLDTNLLHVIWGFSKDLCLTSFRTGVIHTENVSLQNALKSGSQFQAVPLPLMHILTNVISDADWFKNKFVPTNHSRLRATYAKCKEFFCKIGFTTTKSTAGFFFLVDLRPLFNPPSQEASKAFVKKLYAHKIYMTPSWEMGAEHGWFRFVFTAYSTHGLDIGLARLAAAIDEWKRDISA